MVHSNMTTHSLLSWSSGSCPPFATPSLKIGYALGFKGFSKAKKQQETYVVLPKGKKKGQEMELQEAANKRSKKYRRNRNTRISFSARLPDDVSGVFADSICAVKYSTNPFSDIRDSILEMIQKVGVQNWREMEELIYCYIFLNSSEVHNVIEDAFLSLLFL